MKVYHCRRCGDSWSAPDESEMLWWDKLVSSHSKDESAQMGAFKWLTDHTAYDDQLRKVIAGHIPFESGRCAYCRSALKSKGVVECTRCKSLNFNFSAGG